MIPVGYGNIEQFLRTKGLILAHFHAGDLKEPRIHLVLIGEHDLDIPCFISKPIRYDSRNCTLVAQLKAKDSVHENLDEFVELIKYFEVEHTNTKRLNLK